MAYLPTFLYFSYPKLTLIDIPNDIIYNYYQLGDIQSDFSSFIDATIKYNNNKFFNPSNDEKRNIVEQLKEREKYIDNLNKQLELKQKDLNLSTSIYDREKVLYNKDLTSKYEMEVNEQTYISKEQDLLQLKTSIELAKIENSQLKGSVNKLITEQVQDKNQLISNLKSTFRALKTTLDNWMQNYVLVAPQDGIVTFNSFWRKNQYITAGDKVLTVVPQNRGMYIGKIKLPVDGSGKVKIGQKAYIKVTGYPYLEFGVLKGRIKSKSLVTNDNYYTLEIELTNGLHSTTGKDLKFTGELSGTAEIITEDRTLFERFYSPLKYLTNKALN